MSPAIDTVAFFDALSDEMNASTERLRIVGDADMTAVVVMHRPGGDLRVRLVFEGLICAGVAEVGAEEAGNADFALVGDLADWQGMFDDIVANGRATGLWTINSLALLGDRISCQGDDPMGLDKFSRFNQTLQEFFDGAARIAVAA